LFLVSRPEKAKCLRHQIKHNDSLELPQVKPGKENKTKTVEDNSPKLQPTTPVAAENLAPPVSESITPTSKTTQQRPSTASSTKSAKTAATAQTATQKTSNPTQSATTSQTSSKNSSSNQAQTKNPPKPDRDKPAEVNLELDPNKLIEYTNQLFLIHYNKGLNSDSKHILIDLWSNKDYQEIESSRGIKTKAIRKITSNLFEHLSNVLGEKVHLRNLREVMNKHYRAYHSLSP